MTALKAAGIALLFLGLRSGIILSLQFLAKTKWADKTRIDKTAVTAEQESREQRWIMGMLLDGAVLYFLLISNFFNFTPHYWQNLGGFLLAHVFIVEPVYYVYHRLLHTRYLYKHHHILHHLSVVTRPVTSYTFTFLERLSYTFLFSVPVLVLNFTMGISLGALFTYYALFDVLNSMGHLNFEFFPYWYQKSFLKWVLYTPSFHRQHHKRYIKNYCLFMPIFDKIFGTVCPYTDQIYEQAKKGS